MTAETRPRVGLALSGGVAKVVAHVGVLHAFEEAGVPIDAIAATSGGSIIGAFYCAGTSIADMEAMAEELSWKKLTRMTIPRLGLLSNEKLERFVIERVPVQQFEDLQRPLAVITANLTTGRKEVFTQGPLALPIRASCSIPQLFPPVVIDGHLVADGGLVEYLPIQTLEEFDCDIRIGINLGGVRNWHMRDPRNFFEVALRVIGFVSQRNARISESFADHVIRPNLAEFGPYDLDRAADLIRVGYEAGRAAAPVILALIEAQTEHAPARADWTRLVRWLKDNSPLQVFGRRTT